MSIAIHLRQSRALLDDGMRRVDRQIAHAVDSPILSRLLTEPGAARATARQRIANTAHWGAAIVGHASAAAPAAALLVLGHGNPQGARDPNPSVAGMAYGLLGLADRKAVSALAQRPRQADGQAAALLGISLATRAIAFLPRLACRLAIAIGLVAGALVGGAIAGTGQAGIELIRVAIAAFQRRRAAAAASQAMTAAAQAGTAAQAELTARAESAAEPAEIAHDVSPMAA